MTALRALVCDDEPLAVRRLTSMLAKCDDVEVVGEATGGQEAIDLARQHLPDLLLLDIEMPDIDGFDVVDVLATTRGKRAPLIALVTAYPRFAPQAFDTGAIDFLSKPIRSSRLEVTLSRARDALRGREAERRLVELEAMLQQLRSDRDPGRETHIWVARRNEVIRVDLDRVDRIAAEGAYVRLYVDGDSYLHREPIGEIGRRLDPVKFVRVHRSHLVKIELVSSIRRTIHGGGELILVSGDRLPLGRKYSVKAKRLLMAASTEDLRTSGIHE